MQYVPLVKRALITLVVFGMLFWVHGFVQTLVSPVDTALTVGQARDVAPVPHGILATLVRFDVPSIVFYLLALVAVFVIWAVPKKAS